MFLSLTFMFVVAVFSWVLLLLGCFYLFCVSLLWREVLFLSSYHLNICRKITILTVPECCFLNKLIITTLWETSLRFKPFAQLGNLKFPRPSLLWT